MNLPNAGNEDIPPGATPEAHHRPTRGDHPEEFDPGDADAYGTPAGGTAYGGLGGTNIDDGSPDNVDLEAAMHTGIHDNVEDDDTDVEAESGEMLEVESTIGAEARPPRPRSKTKRRQPAVRRPKRSGAAGPTKGKKAARRSAHKARRS